MNKSIQLYSEVKDGHLSDDCRQDIIRALRTLSGGYAKITIERRKKTRSLSQNAYYWSVVVPLIHEMFTDAGNSVDEEEVHNFLKDEIGKLTKYVKLPNGEFKQVSGSTAKMGTVEFEEYLEKVRAWAAEFNLLIPLPNEKLN